jgi:hypothetical protein
VSLWLWLGLTLYGYLLAPDVAPGPKRGWVLVGLVIAVSIPSALIAASLS